MPRKSRAKKPASPASAVMEQLAEQGIELKTAADLPAQLPPAQLELEPLPRTAQGPKADLPPESRELIQPAPEQGRPRRSHAEAILASRPSLLPVPDGFKSVKLYPSAGVRVNRGVDKQKNTLGASAIQFAEDRPLSRATEYDLMTMIQDAGFTYQSSNRQWVRPYSEGASLGDNVIDAVGLADRVVQARGGRGR